MSIIESEDYCFLNIKKIPQFSGTCWFNSILNIMLYSNGLRKILKNVFQNRKKPRDDKLLTFILFMLKNYNNIEELEKVYTSFQNFTLKTEYLLLSYLNKYDRETKEKIIKQKFNFFGYNSNYINNIFINYNIPFISLKKDKITNNIYFEYNNLEKNENINFVEDIINIDILLFNINDISNIKYEDLSEKRKLDYYKTNFTNFDKFKKDLYDINEIITINDINYKLDCFLISNNYGDSIINKLYNFHAISGITCNNNKYLIDSRTNYILNETDFIKKYTYKNLKLYKYNWYLDLIKNKKNILTINNTTLKIENNIILDQKKTIELLSSKISMSFTLKDSRFIFVYIKQKPIEISRELIIKRDNSRSNTNINFSNLKLGTLTISRNIKSLYQLNNLSIQELFMIIKENIYPAIILNETFKNFKKEYRYLYYLLTNNIFDSSKSNNDSLKDLFISIIKKYILDTSIYNLNNINDNIIFDKYINSFNEKNIEILLDMINNKFKITLSNDDLIKYTDIIKKDLFETENKFYFDLNIKKIIKNDDIKQILIKILMNKVLLQKSYYFNNKKQRI